MARAVLLPLALGLAAGAPACGEPAFTVVTVDARPAVSDVRTLAVTLANANATQSESFLVDGRSFPLTFSVDTGDRSGQLAITVDALDGAGVLVGRGEATATIVDDGNGAAAVTLEPTDFQVNTTFVGDQTLAFRFDAGGRQIAVGPDGVATIGWTDSCPIAGRCDVYGRRFSATGRPLISALAAGSGEFIVNRTDVTGYEPSLATSAEGHTLAVWSTGSEILAVALDDDGDALTGLETVVASGNLPTTPAVVAVPDGRFIVAWTERVMLGQYQVRVRYLSREGEPTINPVTLSDAAYTVSTTALADSNPPALAWLGDGLAVAVAWRTGSSIRGRFYTAAGGPRAAGDLLLAGRPATDRIGEPQLAAIAGDAALLYPRSTTGGDADDGKLVLRRITAAGQVVGLDALVTDVVEDSPAALASSGSSLAAAWTTCGADSDGDGCTVRVRRFDPALAPLGASRLASNHRRGDQEQPSLAFLPDGSLLVTWTDGSTAGPDIDGRGIRARILYDSPTPTLPRSP